MGALEIVDEIASGGKPLAMTERKNILKVIQ
jgi:hypothetical protein